MVWDPIHIMCGVGVLGHHKQTGVRNKERSYFHGLFPNVFWFMFPNHVFTVMCNPQASQPATHSHTNVRHHPSHMAWRRLCPSHPLRQSAGVTHERAYMHFHPSSMPVGV